MVKRFVFSLFMVLALAFSFSATAQAADDCPESTTDQCEGVGTDAGPVDEDEPVGALPKGLEPDTEVLGRQQLPVTGAESVTIAAGGAILALAGFALVRRSNAATA